MRKHTKTICVLSMLHLLSFHKNLRTMKFYCFGIASGVWDEGKFTLLCAESRGIINYYLLFIATSASKSGINSRYPAIKHSLKLFLALSSPQEFIINNFLKPHSEEAAKPGLQGQQL